jgi:hypothetical protein
MRIGTEVGIGLCAGRGDQPCLLEIHHSECQQSGRSTCTSFALLDPLDTIIEAVAAHPRAPATDGPSPRPARFHSLTRQIGLLLLASPVIAFLFLPSSTEEQPKPPRTKMAFQVDPNLKLDPPKDTPFSISDLAQYDGKDPS